uniref:Arabinogalactan peptide 22 n=1 Tax=Oryza brachyantha TaxID=4533 RepID=J3LAU2_ORYBR
MAMVGSIKVQAVILTYVLLAVLLHPLLCQGSPPASLLEAHTSDGKTIDQGIAYVLMIVALVVTYLVG